MDVSEQAISELAPYLNAEEREELTHLLNGGDRPKDLDTDAHKEIWVPKTDKELQTWMWEFLGVYVGDKQVCDNHCSPLEAVAEAYFAKVPRAVWYGSRGLSGKTILLAALSVTEAITLGCGVVLLGGSRDQSQRVHAYMSGDDPAMPGCFFGHPNAPKHLLASDPSRSETRLTNRGFIKAVPASMKVIRGLHPQRMRGDEIDEMDAEVWEASQGCPMESAGVKEQTVGCSTWQHPNGVMTHEMKDAEERGRPVRTWCTVGSTMVLTDCGEKRIDSINPGDMVMTRDGWRPVQHRTAMGIRKVVEVEFSNGRSVRGTFDHRVATPDGWTALGDLSLGAEVEGFHVDLLAGAAVPPIIRGADVKIVAGIRMPSWTVSLGQLALRYSGSSGVLGQRDWLQMVRVYAGRVIAKVVDGEPLRNWAFPEHVGYAMSAGCPELLPPSADNAVSLVGRHGPAPTSIFLDGHAGSHEGLVDSNPEAFSILASDAGSAPGTPSPDDARAARARFHVTRTTTCASPEQVYDIGVHGRHEFVAEGVVVENCFRESLAAGWLSREMVLRKQASMSKRAWAVEVCLAKPYTMGKRVYTNYDRRYNCGPVDYDPGNEIYIGVDFNVNPMCAVAGFKIDDELHIFDEINIWGATTQHLALEILHRYTTRFGNPTCDLLKFVRHPHNIHVYPDASGQYGRRTGSTDIEILENEGFQCWYPRKNPNVSDRINEVNVLLWSADGRRRLKMDDRRAPNLCDHMEQVAYKKDTSIVNKALNIEHDTDALGYLIHGLFPLVDRGSFGFMPLRI